LDELNSARTAVSSVMSNILFRHSFDFPRELFDPNRGESKNLMKNETVGNGKGSCEVDYS